MMSSHSGSSQPNRHSFKRHETPYNSSKSRRLSARLRSVDKRPWSAMWMLLGLLCYFALPTHAVLIPFDNCLPSSYRDSDPTTLQFVPLYADARFDSNKDTHTLQVILWGNVTGSLYKVDLPPPGDPRWDDEKDRDGKILRVPEPNAPKPVVTALNTQINFLTYRPFREHEDFCRDKLVNASCPLAPIFNTTEPSGPYNLPSINITNDFSSSYAFTSFSTTFLIIYGDSQATNIGCASSTITPDLGSRADLVKWLPLVVLIFVGCATIFASIFSPCGTSDVFRWSSNFGRDADLLRLVTPGFGDCLQYIQFVVLTGGLTLNYPGFYRPIVSQAGWSVVMFNESFVSDTPAWQAVQDGIYVTDGNYGLQHLAQLMGMSDVEDIWIGMMVWLLVIIGAFLVLIQVGFFLRWIYRLLSSTAEEDLRAKNLPFSVGNIIRVVFNYFLLPIVALSSFQLVVADESAGYAVALAAITLAIVVVFAGWLLFLIIRTRPRAVLFDDLPTVLLYGPLYNTYSDEAATFALIPVLLTFIRGIAIGAVQPVGIAQLVMLAICEVIQVLTLHAFRPFSSPTSMNAFHTLFSVIRFTTIMLMVAFVPDLGVTEGPKGWIGYAILVMHAGVLVLGFFLNALQKITEVALGMMGAGGDDGLARGSLAKIFGMRQLRRRVSRRTNGPSRASHLSSTAMLNSDEVSKTGYSMPGGRLRSESAGSGFLLRGHHRNSSALDSIDALSMPTRNFDSGSILTPTTPGEASTFSFLPSPGAGSQPQPTIPLEAADPYYRPPRHRGDTLTGSIHSERNGPLPNDGRRYSQVARPLDAVDMDNPIGPPERTQTPAPISISLVPRADYSTREVDFYYGVRGPALNSEGIGRKLGTGPADPTGPMALASGWVRNMLGGKTKEKGKGFEVVRSARMPPAMRAAGGEFSDESPPEGIPVAMGVLRNGPIDSDDDEPQKKTAKEPKQGVKQEEESSSKELPNDLLTGEEAGHDRLPSIEFTRISEAPPMLPGIETGDSLRLPSRVASKASRQSSQKQYGRLREIGGRDTPDIPRKSSKRHSRGLSPTPSLKLVPVGSPTQTSAETSRSLPSNRLPFQRSGSQKRLSGSSVGATDEYSQADLNEASPSPDERPTSFGYVAQHSISRVDPDQRRELDLLGTSAELVDDDRGPSSRASQEDRSY